MPKNTSAAKARTAKPYYQPKTERTEAIREFAQQGEAYTMDMYEKT